MLSEIIRKLSFLNQKTCIVNPRGDLSIDGLHIGGIDGERALYYFAGGVKQDIVERGLAGTMKLYREKARTPGGLGHALQASLNISRICDADEIAGK